MIKFRRSRGLPWTYDDGGRLAAGFPKPAPGDCAARSIAIATGLPYLDVCDLIEEFAKAERFRDGQRSSAHGGVFKWTFRRTLEHLGWAWYPTMAIGSGCTVHLRVGELPAGRLIARVSKHMVAIVNGMMRDTHDPSRNGTRCVYGYWTPGPTS